MPFGDKRKLYQALSSLGQEDFVIPLMGYHLPTVGAFRALGRSQARYAISTAPSMPLVEHKRPADFIKKLKAVVMRNPVDSIVQLTFLRIPPAWLGIRQADFIIAGGTKTLRLKDKGPVQGGSEIIWAHTFDYDAFLKEKGKENHDTEDLPRYAVFIDQYFPFHPDLIQFGQETPEDFAEHYYALVRKSFELIEHETGLEIIVAAHPRSNYDDKPDFFDKRKVIKGRTAALIKHSSLVVLHYSTALNLALLFGKPVLFLNNRRIDVSFPYGALIAHEAARLLGKTVLEMDSANTESLRAALRGGDPALVGQYIEDFIKTKQSPDLPLWQIVANRIKMLE